MTSLVAIGSGKQTVQRISIRFPKREGQSRVSIRFQAVERGGPFGSSAIFRGSRFSSTAERVVGGISSLNLERYQIHPLFFLARPLVQLCEQSSGRVCQCFQVFVSPVLHALKHGERSVGKIRKSVGEFRNV